MPVEKFNILHACYAILHRKGMGSEIPTIVKANELLSVMTGCRNAFHNGAIAHTYHPHNFCGVRSFNGKNISML